MPGPGVQNFIIDVLLFLPITTDPDFNLGNLILYSHGPGDKLLAMFFPMSLFAFPKIIDGTLLCSSNISGSYSYLPGPGVREV